MKNWLAADSTPFAAPQEPNKDGNDEKELPNMQYVEIKGGRIVLPVDRPAEEIVVD